MHVANSLVAAFYTPMSHGPGADACMLSFAQMVPSLDFFLISCIAFKNRGL
jgi:hypothetical protein